MRSIIRMLVAGALFLGGTVAEPATADHQLVYGSWHPSVHFGVANLNAPRVSVEDAMYYWEDLGGKGYTEIVDGVFQECTWHYGWVTVCYLPRGTMVVGNRLGDGRGGTLVNSEGYAIAGLMAVANDLDPVRRQQVFRHEGGHSWGLGHTADRRCVMHQSANAPPGAVCQHDVDAILLANRL